MKSNKKFMRRVNKLDALIAAENARYAAQDEKLREQYDVPSIADAYGTQWSDEQWNYLDALGPITSDHERALAILNAKKATAILLGTGIARRGKPLHQTKIERGQKKLGKYADFVNDQRKYSVFHSIIISDAPYLHLELQKHGIQLLDENYLTHLKNVIGYLDDKISYLAYQISNENHEHGMHPTSLDKRLTTAQNKLKCAHNQVRKFHRDLIMRQIERANATEIAF